MHFFGRSIAYSKCFFFAGLTNLEFELYLNARFLIFLYFERLLSIISNISDYDNRKQFPQGDQWFAKHYFNLRVLFARVSCSNANIALYANCVLLLACISNIHLGFVFMKRSWNLYCCFVRRDVRVRVNMRNISCYRTLYYHSSKCDYRRYHDHREMDPWESVKTRLFEVPMYINWF